jgi:hypothetical protein
MAGAGFRSWVDEEPLYAADVVSYLMEQSVMVFADATARDLALPTPTEGMVVYTKDDNGIRYFDGTLWNAIGEITGGSGISVSESTSSFTISLNVDAKGDLLVGTANDTVSRVAVGTNGQTLFANSSTSTGVEWADPFTFESPLPTQTESSDFTLSSSDAGNLIYVDTQVGDVTITLPDIATDAGLQDGMQFMFMLIVGSNDVIFQAGGSAGVGSKSGYSYMSGRYAAATAIYYAANDFYILVGDLG